MCEWCGGDQGSGWCQQVQRRWTGLVDRAESSRPLPGQRDRLSKARAMCGSECRCRGLEKCWNKEEPSIWGSRSGGDRRGLRGCCTAAATVKQAATGAATGGSAATARGAATPTGVAAIPRHDRRDQSTSEHNRAGFEWRQARQLRIRAGRAQEGCCVTAAPQVSKLEREDNQEEAQKHMRGCGPHDTGE